MRGRRIAKWYLPVGSGVARGLWPGSPARRRRRFPRGNPYSGLIVYQNDDEPESSGRRADAGGPLLAEVPLLTGASSSVSQWEPRARPAYYPEAPDLSSLSLTRAQRARASLTALSTAPGAHSGLADPPEAAFGIEGGCPGVTNPDVRHLGGPGRVGPIMLVVSSRPWSSYAMLGRLRLREATGLAWGSAILFRPSPTGPSTRARFLALCCRPSPLVVQSSGPPPDQVRPPTH